MQDDQLTKLHPNHVKAMRVAAILTALPFLAGAFIFGLIGAEIAEIEDAGFTQILLVLGGLLALVLAAMVVMVPIRRYHARGYNMGEDRLRVVRGILFRHDSVVPFGRVQHLDVEQGPIERLYGLGTLVLHTAGTHNASVRLPGLGHNDALEMREAIRAHVRAEIM